MDTNKVLSALSYFSIFFAGFLFPLILFLITEDKEVKRHAKKALLSHLIPLIPVPFILFSAFFGMIANGQELPILFILAIVVTVILTFVVFIWNIVKGIQVLSKESIS